MAINSVRTFRDLDLNFRKNPATKDVATRVGDQAVIRSIRNLLYLGNYEKPFHPEIGCQVNNLLFEPFDPITEAVMEQTIYDVVSRFEPRVTLLKVKVSSTVDSNGVEVSVTFKVKNNPTPINLITILSRVR